MEYVYTFTDIAWAMKYVYTFYATITWAHETSITPFALLLHGPCNIYIHSTLQEHMGPMECLYNFTLLLHGLEYVIILYATIDGPWNVYTPVCSIAWAHEIFIDTLRYKQMGPWNVYTTLTSIAWAPGYPYTLRLQAMGQWNVYKLTPTIAWAHGISIYTLHYKQMGQGMSIQLYATIAWAHGVRRID